MKRKIAIAVFLAFLTAGAFPAGARASETSTAQGVLDQIKQQLSDAFDDMDQETAGEVFDFLKDQAADGNLSSGEGIQKAIDEGEEKFGVTISEADAKELVDTMEKLEDLGFSAEYVVDKAGSLYDEYGADFVDHADELVKGAVKNAASNAVSSFWQNLKNSIKNFFAKLF
ncbi:MAG: DUF1002 domain-containing protein [Lachnospiraceae bacterium]|nr:DUF1002 domain-containing protein [Lachnospiraceae bacterium]